MSGDLDGSVAVVTGTSPNIGAGIAFAFAEAGAAVACLDADQIVAERCSDAIQSSGGRALGLRCDVTEESEVHAAFDRIVAELGTPRTLVNAAAIFNMKGIVEMTVGEWRRQLDIILTGTFLCTQTAIALMRKGNARGSIINLTSSAAHQGEPGNVCYGTAKAGLLNFTRAVAMDAARFGIRVNSLSPTATDPRDGLARAEEWGLPVTGPFADPARVDDFLADVLKKVPLGELPRPTDYGRAAVFLASDAARLITGTDLRVDAGTIAKYWRWDPGNVSDT